MPAQTSNLFLIEDLADSSSTENLADTHPKALHTVADWSKTFVIRPNMDLGGAGLACPFTNWRLIEA
jgi:hypothetical protein